MCEMLGTEPLEEQIPVEIADFSEDLQQVFEIYSMVPDIWEGFSGQYMGKDTSNIFNFFGLYKVDIADQLFYLRLLKYMDKVRMEMISQKIKTKQELQKK